MVFHRPASYNEREREADNRRLSERCEVMPTEVIERLKKTAIAVRKNLLTMIYEAKSGHPGGSLSAADLMTALYFYELNLRPEDPHWPERDRFVLSKGHVCPVLYTCLAMRGYFPMEQLSQLRKYGSILQGHPDMKRTPGIEISTGSLGQGISTAAGMALGNRRKGNPGRVFCMLGDGECNEGQVWEAFEAASKYELGNLVVIIDHNQLQNDGCCEEIMPPGSLHAKLEAFGFLTYTIDGHDMEAIVNTLDKIRNAGDPRPKAIIAKTIKGRGVSFMEGAVAWHGQAPNDAEYEKAMAEIEGGLEA